MAVLGRGCRLLTLYINPECFRNGDRDWAFLGVDPQVGQTQQRHAMQRHTTDPWLPDCARQPYGYAHFCGQRGIVALRNPFVGRQDVEVRLDETAGWNSREAAAGDGRFVVKVVYPRHEVLPRVFRYGDTLKLPLNDYETLILHVEPLPSNTPVVAGARCRQGRLAGDRAEYELFGPPGQERHVAVFGPAPVRATLDDGPVELVRRGDRIEFTLPAGETIEAAAEGGQLTVQPSGNGFKLVGRCSVRVPPKATASVRLLCDFHGKEQQPLACQATVNGQPAKVEIIRKKLEQEGEDSEPDYSWAWLKFDVPTGQSQIELTIDNYQADGKPLAGQVGWWLWTDRLTKPHKLVLEFDRAVVPPIADPLPLPLEMEHFRQVVPIRRLIRRCRPIKRVGTHNKEDCAMRTIMLLAVSISWPARRLCERRNQLRNLALNRAAYASSCGEYYKFNTTGFIDTGHMATDGHLETMCAVRAAGRNGLTLTSSRRSAWSRRSSCVGTVPTPRHTSSKFRPTPAPRVNGFRRKLDRRASNRLRAGRCRGDRVAEAGQNPVCPPVLHQAGHRQRFWPRFDYFTLREFEVYGTGGRRRWASGRLSPRRRTAREPFGRMEAR